VFILCRGILKTPALQRQQLGQYISWLPFVTALIFLIHPLQTQAVTYIVQRLSSLAALFYLASLASYVWARLSSNRSQKAGLLVACGIFGIMAFFTKQNTITLPLAILAMEAILFQTKIGKLLTSILITAGILSGFWLVCSQLLGYDPFSLAALDRLTKETEEISRGDYFLSQIPLLWQYIGLFFWPKGLHLDYWSPLYQSVTPLIMVAMAAHGVVIAFAVAFFRRLPIIAFAVIFYYITHLVESGFIPIKDLFFEHRAYLPDFALCLLVAWILTVIVPKYLSAKNSIVIAVMLFLALGVTTWQRNNVWRTPMGFWADCVKNDPNNYRALGELGKHLLIEQRYQEAYTVLDHSLKLQDELKLSFKANKGVAVNMVTALQHTKGIDPALEYLDTILDKEDDPQNMAKLLINKGKMLMSQNKLDEAATCFVKALELDKTDRLNYITMSNLGVINAMKGNFDEAERLFTEALRLEPGYQQARENLNILYMQKENSKGKN
jgi:tetratricopeptide (TPR) repeat protein